MLKKSIIRILILTGMLLSASFAQERLYVFYPLSTTRALVLQQLLTEISPNRQIKVFEDPEQFISSVINEKPEIIITKQFVISQLNGYASILRGIRDNQNIDSWVLLSVSKPVKPDNPGKKTIVGMVEFSNPQNIVTLVEECTHKKVDIISVNKPENLVFLLVQGRIECTVIPKALAHYLKTAYNLDFFVTPLSCNDSDIISCAVRPGTKGSYFLRREFSSESGKSIAQLFGIDLWKKVN